MTTGGKNFFFDRAAVIKAVDRQTRSVLSKFGAYVRRTAKGSIKKAAPSKLEKVKRARKVLARSKTPATQQLAMEVLMRAQQDASAPAGQPPRSVKGFLKDHIFFVFEPARRGVIIGPEALGAAVAPKALEQGGRSITKIRRGGQTISRVVTVRPHPYMGPAVAKVEKQLPSLWATAGKKSA